MKKRWKVLLILLFIILIGIAIAYILFFLQNKVNVAYLYIDRGVVQISKNSEWKTITGDIPLSVKDSVRTLDGKATIVFYEGEILRLESNTEIKISELSKNKIVLKQSIGTTWSKVTKLAGINSYRIETPDTVATVRGTGFGVLVSEGSSDVFVGDGVVDVGSENVTKNKKINAVKGKLSQMQDVTEIDKEFIEENKALDLALLKQMRMKIIKESGYYKLAKKTMKFNDSIVETFLDKVDRGEINENKILDKYPVSGEIVNRLLDINEVIKKNSVK